MKNKYQALLFDRIQENYASFIASLSSADRTGKAAEISAAQMVKDRLMGSVGEQQAKWLLRFENPLEIMRDKWLEENGMKTVWAEDCSHALWSVMHCQDTERLYPLAPGVGMTPGHDAPMTVKDFIEQHSDASLDLTTPGGSVYLTSARARLLLAGRDIKGYYGNHEYATEITAEVLLSQGIIEAKFIGREWRICTADHQEMTQNLSSLDQGVSM